MRGGMGNHCPQCTGQQGAAWVDCRQSEQYYINAGEGPYPNPTQTIANYNQFMGGFDPTSNLTHGETKTIGGKNPDPTMTIGELMRDFQVGCNTGPYDPSTAFYCDSPAVDQLSCPLQRDWMLSARNPYDGPQCTYLYGAGAWSVEPAIENNMMLDWYNSYQWYFYKMCALRIIALCGEQHYDDVWPAFYYFYDTQLGKEAIDGLIAAKEKAGTPLPQACIDALKTNYDPVVQQRYCLLNEGDFSTVTWDFVYDASNKPCPSQGSAIWLPPNAQNGTDDFIAIYTGFFLKKTVMNTNWERGLWGNPLWNHNEKAEALTKVLTQGSGVDQTNFLQKWAQSYADQGLIKAGIGESAVDYLYPQQHAGEISWVTDPAYVGNLPHLASYQIGNEPWHKVTTDPKAYGYHNPCLDKPFLDEIMPIAVGGLAGGFGAMFVPGNKAKIITAGTLGYAGYTFTQGVLGYAAVVDWNDIDAYNKDNAALALSLGLPAAVYEMLWETSLLPNSILAQPSYQYIGVGASITAGYFLLNPILKPALEITGGIATWIQAPLAYIEEGLTMLFNGCASHMIVSNVTCMCEGANNKPALAEALVGPIYGCTDQQYTLRKECLHKAMTTGLWGSDPYAIGTCDSNGHMNDPTDCLSAGEWAYQRFPENTSINPFSDKDAIIKQAALKWAEVSYCVDETNPSFLPPRDIDKPCAQYGPHFRMINGTCLDQTMPIGQQDPEN